MADTGTSESDIQSIISQLISGEPSDATTPPSVSVAPLNFTAPSISDVSSQYQTFLNQAANNTDLINYYQQLLQQAQGDTQIAISQLENDYQTGVRNTTDNLSADLQQLGLTFTNENQSLKNTLNQRGIALTQSGPGQSSLTYSNAGGESGYEQSQLLQSQQLRSEAEQRTAQQNITGLGNTLDKGLTSQGQQLTQFGQNLQNSYEGSVASMANTNMGLYTQAQQAAANTAAMNQKSQTQAMNAGGSTTPTLAQRTAAYAAAGGKGNLPVGFDV
jgi:hypothetical protein